MNFLAKIKKDIHIYAILLLILIAAELIIYNKDIITSKVMGLEQIEINFEENITKSSSVNITDNGYIHIKNGGYIEITGISDKVRFVGINSYGQGSFATMNTYIKDDGNSVYCKTGGHTVLPGGEDDYLHIKPKDKLYALKIEFENSCKNLYIKSITLNQTKAFGINLFRLILLIIIIFFIVYFRRNKLYKLLYDRNNFKHNLLIIASMFFCILLTLIGSLPSINFTQYPFKDEIEKHSHYEQQFDAFQKGQLNLDIELDVEAYRSLNNPYDINERREKLGGTGALWDRAYFEDKVYMYFGVAPVLFIHYPVYLLTGTVPSDGFVSFILTIIAVITMFFALLELLKTFKIKPQLLLLILTPLALFGGSQVTLLSVHPSVYYGSIIGGIGFLALAITFILKAYNSVTQKRRTAFLIGAGISAVLIVGTRPALILFLVMTIPFLLKMFFNKDYLIKEKIINFTSIAIPLIIGAVAVMWYNNARFSSPFDFGNNYQLTMSDVSKNTLDLNKFFISIYHYFIQPVSYTGTFPFISPSYSNLNIYQGYTYIFSSFGALNFPAVWGIAGSCHVSKDNNKKRFMYLSAIGIAIVIGFMNLCMAGVHMRYVADLMFPLVLVGLAVIIEVSSKNIDHEYGRKIFNIAVLLVVMTILISIAFIFKNEANHIYNDSPKIYAFFANLFN
ncbi:hypothetical protein LJB90_00145 [Eubacteriales bacterium OttesenSCG-928-G02]|nr:hypothetical protein [Eubacteriales bacterium OttesenSCG-928-G02]